MSKPDQPTGFLGGVRVVELTDELGEYCGKVLAGLGADVVKIEPPNGEITRGYGPFRHDIEDPDGSLHYWHYNFGKQSVCLNLELASDRQVLRRLVGSADVLLETRPRGYLASIGLDPAELRTKYPRLIVARISPFGDSGPWSDYAGSDLVHLALGGVVMNNGYDPLPDGTYDTPPVAPQMWHAYHVAGENMVMAILGALIARHHSGRGQQLSEAVHDAVSKSTESDVYNWLYSAIEHHRQTCRHSMPEASLPSIAMLKDGRWLLPYRSYVQTALGTGLAPTRELLRKYGMQVDLDDPKYNDADYVSRPEVALHIGAAIDQFISRFRWSAEIWREAQQLGLAWAPIRRPEENTTDEHWRQRDTFIEVDHPDIGETYAEVGAKWLCLDVPWRHGPCAPALGEHTGLVCGELPAGDSTQQHGQSPSRPLAAPTTALDGVRVLDLSWLLASAGAGRYLAALGAEVIKIEHASRPDGMRFPVGVVPEGGRPERDAATGPIITRADGRLNRSGAFMDINCGKRGMSLNLKHQEARTILAELVRISDVVIEGFSPGTMDRLGFGYDWLRSQKSDIIYIQQSGMGQIGTYGRMRSYGPTAQAFAGLSDMSGFPTPYPPAGIGFSFLDWCGAYNMATAVLAALYRREVNGAGCWIDSSQVEAGTYLTGTAVLNQSVNNVAWTRIGNTSPFKRAAPHGVYRTRGRDRWMAMACFDEQAWQALCEVLQTEWRHDDRFASMQDRLANADVLDQMINDLISDMDGYALMDALQRRGVPAGVCQTAADRFDLDPQLRHLQWTIELPQSEIGTWPVMDFPVRMSGTPATMGGPLRRHGPSYAEDNDYVYGELLGYDAARMKQLRDDGVL
jgi:crotonobetainyl-CoA:carnitine CoA-transferase CaiB-like acyl-CoA transferase